MYGKHEKLWTEKAAELQEILSEKNIDKFEHDLGLSVLRAWVHFYNTHGWEDKTAAAIEKWLEKEIDAAISLMNCAPDIKSITKRR